MIWSQSIEHNIPEASHSLHILRHDRCPTQRTSFLIMIHPTVQTSPVENVFAVRQAPDFFFRFEVVKTNGATFRRFSGVGWFLSFSGDVLFHRGHSCIAAGSQSCTVGIFCLVWSVAEAEPPLAIMLYCLLSTFMSPLPALCFIFGVVQFKIRKLRQTMWGQQLIRCTISNRFPIII